jgi:glycosyltransferase involved in cell wall biosynthesis
VVETMKISLVIPVWNERTRLARTARGVESLRTVLDGGLEVLLVDDGSTDGTAEQAEALGLQVLRQPHRGKGAAVRAGMLAVSGEYRLQADADWSMPPEQFLRMLPPRCHDFDLATASRELAESQRHGEPQWRHLLGRAWNRVVQGLVLSGIEDSQCGFKCFRGEVAQQIFSQCTEDGWAADVEVLALARAAGLALVEIPIDWYYDADSRVRPVRDVPAMIGTALRVRRRVRKMEHETSGGER